MLSLATAAHVAHLDMLTGEGLLVLPSTEDDIADPLPGPALTLHECDWSAMLALLDSHGWEPSEGEAGGLADVGTTRDGRRAVALYGRQPVTTEPTLEECALAMAALCAAVGVAP